MREAINRFDSKFSRFASRLPSWVDPVMRLFTLLGQPPFTVGISATVLGYGLALEKPFYIEAGVLALGTIIVSSLLKIFLRRKRPASEYVRKMFFRTYSFPSGHAAGSIVSYGLAALVISYRWPELALVAWTTATVSVLFISFSRIYLKAHYASDIIGGWVVGGAGLILILLLEK